jgi:diaminopimelate decarboxylase
VSANDRLERVDGVDLAELARRHGTPLYVYEARAIRGRHARLIAAFAPLLERVHYSVKASSNLALLKLLAAEGAGFDVVSGGEIERCARAGIDGSRIVFAGVGKSDAELDLALARRVGLFDVESRDELERLAARAAAAGVRARFALRLNPDVDAGTHAYVTTGLQRNKFGMPFDEALAAMRALAGAASLEFRGFHVHIGSQVADPGRFRAAAEVVAGRIAQARAAGFAVSVLDFGGGFAARYDADPPPIEAVAAAVKPVLAPLNVELLLEPGRYLVAEAGLLLVRVITVKPAPAKTFVVVDAAMNDLIRPALYGARHPLAPVGPPPSDEAARPLVKCDLVGPICESGDFLAQDRELPLPRAGDLIAILSAGAYGFSMAGNYNSRPRAAEVLIDAGSARLIRRRETIDDLLGPELLDGPKR